MCHAPAVAIGAHVGRGGEKRAHYGRLRRLQFHPVEATGDAIAGNKGEPCENLGDVRVVDSFGHLAEQRIGDGARRQQRRSRIGSSALAPIVLICARIDEPCA